MDLEIRHLRLVTAIAETGSVTRAGERLFLTQSALSHQLRDIEERLQTRLFHRAGKRMIPTAAGQELLRSAAEVLEVIGRTEQRLKQAAESGDGCLRLTTQCNTCYHWLPPLLAEYRRTHPKVAVKIDALVMPYPLKALVDGEIDLALMLDPIGDRRVVERVLFRDEMVVITAPNHPFVTKPFVEARDFANETLYIYPPKPESIAYNRVFRRAGVEPGAIEPVQLTEAIVELVRAGLGVSILARWAVQPYVDSGAIAAVRVTERGLERDWTAVTLRSMAALPHVRHFVDLLAAQAPVASGRTKKPLLPFHRIRAAR